MEEHPNDYTDQVEFSIREDDSSKNSSPSLQTFPIELRTEIYEILQELCTLSGLSINQWVEQTLRLGFSESSVGNIGYGMFGIAIERKLVDIQQKFNALNIEEF